VVFVAYVAYGEQLTGCAGGEAHDCPACAYYTELFRAYYTELFRKCYTELSRKPAILP
jgi:hypothetical protein